MEGSEKREKEKVQRREEKREREGRTFLFSGLFALKLNFIKLDKYM